MDYEKKYKETLELAREELQKCGSLDCDCAKFLFRLFPELAEPDKSKEWILKYLYYGLGKSDEQFKEQFKTAIAWLERQGNSPIKWNKNTEGNKPQVNHSVLMKTTHSIAEGEWQGEQKSDSFCREHCKGFQETGKCFADGDCKAKREAEQNSAWSEEDEIKIKSIIAFLKSPSLCAMDGNKGIIDANIKYLKSLKNKVQPQNTWKPSEEQMDALWDKISNDNLPNNEKEISQQVALTELYEQLKKLKGE